MAHSFLPCPECILEEAWAEVEWDTEQQNSGWCETDGVSVEMLATYRRARHLSLYLFHAENLVLHRCKFLVATNPVGFSIRYWNPNACCD